MNTIPGIEQVNMFQTDGNVLHFTNPRGNVCMYLGHVTVCPHLEHTLMVSLVCCIPAYNLILLPLTSKLCMLLKRYVFTV